MVFGQRLRQWRQRKFLTQTQLAKAIPVSLSTVQKWEMGHTLPYPATRRRLIEVLEIEPDEFFVALEAEQAEQAVKSAA